VPYARESNPYFSPPALQYVAYAGGRPWIRAANPDDFDDLGFGLADTPAREDLWWKSHHGDYEIGYFRIKGEHGLGWEVRDRFTGNVIETRDGEELWAAPRMGVHGVQQAERQAMQAIDQLRRRGALPNPYFSPPALQYVSYAGGRPWIKAANPKPVHHYAVRDARGAVVAVLQAHNLDQARQRAAARGFSGRRFTTKRMESADYARHAAPNPSPSLKTWRVFNAAGDVLGMVAAKNKRAAIGQARGRFSRSDLRVELVEHDDPRQSFMFGEDPMRETEHRLHGEQEEGQTYLFNNPCGRRHY
jgi:hypothetical protein